MTLRIGEHLFASQLIAVRNECCQHSQEGHRKDTCSVSCQGWSMELDLIDKEVTIFSNTVPSPSKTSTRSYQTLRLEQHDSIPTTRTTPMVLYFIGDYR